MDIVEELIERGLLRGRAAQQQKDALGGEGKMHWTAIELCLSNGEHVAAQSNEPAFVNRLRWESSRQSRNYSLILSCARSRGTQNDQEETIPPHEGPAFPPSL